MICVTIFMTENRKIVHSKTLTFSGHQTDRQTENVIPMSRNPSGARQKKVPQKPLQIKLKTLQENIILRTLPRTVHYQLVECHLLSDKVMNLLEYIHQGPFIVN